MRSGILLFVLLSVIMFSCFLIYYYYLTTRAQMKYSFLINMKDLISLKRAVSRIEKEYPNLVNVVNSFEKAQRNGLSFEEMVKNAKVVEGNGSGKLTREMRKILEDAQKKKSNKIDDELRVLIWYFITSTTLSAYMNPLQYRFNELKSNFNISTISREATKKEIKEEIDNDKFDGVCIV